MWVKTVCLSSGLSSSPQPLFVKEFGLFSTTFRRVDGLEIIAPNSLLANTKLVHNLRRSNSMYVMTCWTIFESHSSSQVGDYEPSGGVRYTVGVDRSSSVAVEDIRIAKQPRMVQCEREH